MAATETHNGRRELTRVNQVPKPVRSGPVKDHDTGAVPVGNQSMLHAFGLRAKLEVSEPSDPQEFEADRAADAFVAGAAVPAIGERASAPSAVIHRMCDGCAEEEEEEASVSRKATGPAPLVPRLPHFHTAGSPIPVATRRPYEQFFGTDLSRVKVHDDSAAHDAASSLRAHAFARGDDIFFARGRLDFHTNEGSRLLAHELTHVVQSTASRGAVARAGDSAIRRQPAPGPGPAPVEQAITFITQGVHLRMPSMTVPQLRSRSLLELDTIREGVHGATEVWLEHWYAAHLRRAQQQARDERLMGVFLGTPAILASRLIQSQQQDTTGTLEEGIRLLWRAVPLIDRLEIYDEGYREIEQAQLDVIRASSRAERDLALGEGTKPRLERVFSHMNAREEYEARSMFDASPAGRLRIAERMLEREEEEELYDAILNLDPGPRRKFALTDHYRAIYKMLYLWQLKIVAAMVRGSEVDALIARLRLATEGRRDDQAAVTRVIDRAIDLLKERKELRRALASQQFTGSALADAQERIRQLDDLDRLLTFERPKGGALAESSFLGLISSARDDSFAFAADAQRLGKFAASPEDAKRFAFETAKQRILIAGATEDSIRVAIQQLHAPPPTMPADATANAIYVAQLRADEEFRRELLTDSAVRAVVSKLKGSEQRRVLGDISADRYDELIWQMNEANNGGRWGELFHIAILISRSEQWRWRYRDQRQKYFTAESRVSRREGEIVDLILANPGRPPLAEILDYISDVAQLRAVFDDIGEENRALLRLGWILTEHPRIGPPSERDVQAIELYKKVKSHLKESQSGVFGVDKSGIQTVMEVALGAEPTAAELETGEGRYRAALLWYEQHEARLGLERGMSADFTETDETMVGAGREYAALWLQVRDSGTLSSIHFYALANLHQRFSGRAGEFEEASNAIGELAGMIAATIAGIVVIVATGGAATLPVIAMAAAAGGTARVVTREMFGADYYTAESSAGARDALLGSIDGALAVVSGRLAVKGVEFLGLSGNVLARNASRAAGEVAEQATQSLGRRVAAGSVEAAIDGALSGTISEAFGALTDERTWRRGIADGLGRVGAAALLGGLTGGVTGGVVGGAMPVIGSAGRRLWEGIAARSADGTLARVGLSDTLDAARRAADNGDFAEANRLAAQLETHLDPQQVLSLRGDINGRLQQKLGRPPGTATPHPGQEDVLAASGRLDDGLSDAQKQVETDIVARSDPQPSTMAGYVDEVNLGNGHTWRRRPDGSWCRFTKRTLCGTDIPNVKLPPGSEAEIALASARLEAAKTLADTLQEWMANPQLLMQRLRAQGAPPYAFTPVEEDVLLKLFPRLDPEEVTIADLNRALSPPTRSRAFDPTGMTGDVVANQPLGGPSLAQRRLADFQLLVAQRADDLRVLNTPLYKQMREVSPGAIGAEIRRKAKGIDQLSKQKAPSGKLAADHIVPLSDIVRMPNFATLADLDIDEAIRICNLRKNLHAIDFNVNSARGNTSWADDFTYRDTYSKTALDDIIKRENDLRGEIQEEINKALNDARRRGR